MTDRDLSRDILQKIREDNVTPKPRWEFLLKNSAIWTAGITSLIIGGFATSIIIYGLRNDDFDALTETGDSALETILIALPYFWLLLLAIFIFIAHYNYKHTKRGYRNKLSTVLIASVLISVALGIIFYDLGAGKAIDRLLSENAPPYAQYVHPRVQIWIQPEKGRLAGFVIERKDEQTFIIHDFQKHDWTVTTKQPIPHELIPVRVLPKPLKVRCLGKKIDDETFDAHRIMPWIPQQKPILKFLKFMHERKVQRNAY